MTADIEVIAVDDGSADATPEIATRTPLAAGLGLSEGKDLVATA